MAAACAERPSEAAVQALDDSRAIGLRSRSMTFWNEGDPTLLGKRPRDRATTRRLSIIAASKRRGDT